MIRTLIKCPLCPCQFFTQADHDQHLEGFTPDPSEHIRRYVYNMTYLKKLKRRRGRELYKKYLMEKGFKPRKAPKRPKREVLSLNQRLERYAGKIELFQHNYCSSSNTVNRLPCRPSLSGSWLARKMEEGL